jgi:excisionase family DNA binding protein
MEVPRLEQLPIVIVSLVNEVKELKALIINKANPQTEIEPPLNIKEISKLTELSVPTLYGYVQRNEMPYYKKGNRLKFFKSEIIDWIKEGKVKSISEIETDADTYLSNKNKGLK